MDPSPLVIDGFGPLPVVRPQTPADVGDLVRRAAADGHALYPVGGRTMLGLGLPPDRPGVAVEVGALARVIDYPARDMTITVQAGIAVDALQKVLAGENQRLPVDVPRAEQATLGGSLAANVSGARRYGSGTLRDYVIGISTIDDEGHEVKAGGRVVKNVAGYDLCKLHVGALGTLGIITQLTLKVRPRPEARALVALGCDGPGLAPLLDLLHRSRTRPGVLDVVNAGAIRCLTGDAGVALPDAPWVVIAGFEDSDDAVSWQVRQLVAEVSPAGVRGLEARAGAASDSVWDALTELPAQPSARLAFKANLLPAAVADFCLFAAALPGGAMVHAHAGSGVVRGHLTGDLTLAQVQEMLKGMHERLRPTHGNVILPRCPAEWKRVLPVWGLPRDDAWLMRRVKEALDPRRLFNPGRFVDGL